MSGAVIVGSYHDVLGPLFWELFRGAKRGQRITA